MMYYDYLCRLLEPMRVYRTERGTLSGGELYAAGAALDEADGAMEYAEQEGLLQTAEGEGLARREKLFSRCPVSVSTALRREAIAALARINADSFTLDAINSTLSGCGIKALAEETEKKQCWIMLGVFAFAGATMSMSGVFMIPMLLGVGLLPVLLRRKKLKYWGYAVLSVLPSSTTRKVKSIPGLPESRLSMA